MSIILYSISLIYQGMIGNFNIYIIHKYNFNVHMLFKRDFPTLIYATKPPLLCF